MLSPPSRGITSLLIIPFLLEEQMDKFHRYDGQNRHVHFELFMEELSSICQMWYYIVEMNFDKYPKKDMVN